MAKNPLIGFLVCSFIIWLFTYINIRGAKSAGAVGTILVLLKLIILILFIIISSGIFNIQNITPILPTGNGLRSIPMAAAITFWAFEGIESATIASGEIKNPERRLNLVLLLHL